MNQKLQLNIYLKNRSRACLVFKQIPLLYRINNLKDPLNFVADMDLLSKEIKSGKRKDGSYELADYRTRKWVLSLTFENELLFLKVGQHFLWTGTPAEFICAVQKMVKMIG